MIICDFCDAPCTRIASSGPRESRRFTCDAHCDGATFNRPLDARNDWLRVQDIAVAEAIWRKQQKKAARKR